MCSWTQALQFGVDDKPIAPVDVLRTKWFNDDESKTSSMLHSAQSCTVRVRYNDEVITSWLHAFCAFDCKRSCVSAISVYLFCSGRVGGYGACQEQIQSTQVSIRSLAFGSSRPPPVNPACHAVAYGEKPRTNCTCRLSIRLPSKIASLHWKHIYIHTCISYCVYRTHDQWIRRCPNMAETGRIATRIALRN